MDDNPYLSAGKTDNPYLKAGSQPANPYLSAGSTSSEGRLPPSQGSGMGYPSLNVLPPESAASPEGVGGRVGYNTGLDRQVQGFPAKPVSEAPTGEKARLDEGQAKLSSWAKTAYDYISPYLPSKAEFLSPDYASNLLSKIPAIGSKAISSLGESTGPLDPGNLIPNRKQLANDLAGYLFEGGNLGGPGGMGGLVKGGAEGAPAAFRGTIERAGSNYGVSPLLLTRQLRQENGFKVTGVSPKGAAGISQFIPSTAARYGVDVNDPTSSIFGQAHYMSDLKKMFNNNDGLALAGYNWGEGNVKKWIERGANPADMPVETRDYVKSISGHDIESWIKEPNNLRITELASVGGQASVSAARTPTYEILKDNIRRFEEDNKEPGYIERLNATVEEAQNYYETGEAAKGIIQENVGNEARTAAQAGYAMDKFRQFTNSLDQPEQLDLLKWLQDPQSKLSKGLALSPEAQDFVNTFHDWMDEYRNKLENLPQTEKMTFRDNFATQLWRRPKEAMQYIHDYGAKQGSNYFTKARVFDDYEAGIRAGFTPVTTDPMDLFARYIENASAKIASWESLNAAKAKGLIVSRASNPPEGWVPVKGFTPPNFGEVYYAPPGAAKVFNNYMSNPPKGWVGKGLDWAQMAANRTTAFKLAWSGFHATLETGESVISGIANALDKIMGGKVLKGVVELGKAPLKPVMSFAKGREFQKAYLDGEFGSPEMQKIVQSLTDANYDPMREGKLADEYRVSRFPGFIKSFNRGRIKSELKAMSGMSTPSKIVSLGTRAFETAMEPVFQYYIPWLKNTAAHDMMKTYLDAHPNATRSELAGYARQVSNTVDNRFGEMNSNNIFWPALAKKMLRSALISYSYTLGTARLAGGAYADLSALPSKLAFKMAGKLPPNEQVWTPRLSYAIAMGLATGLVNSTYQYLKTGQTPQDAQDLMRPRTGGTDPSTGKPERAVLPMFFNAFRNFWLNPATEAYNKINPLWHSIIELSKNEDWKKLPIYDGNEPVTAQLEQVGRYIGQELGEPITFAQQQQAKEGTHIGTVERLFGLRAAGMKDTDPEKVKSIVSYKTAEAWYEKRKSDINTLRAQQGKPPIHITRRMKSSLIDQYMKNPQTDPLKSYGGTQ